MSDAEPLEPLAPIPPRSWCQTCKRLQDRVGRSEAHVERVTNPHRPRPPAEVREAVDRLCDRRRALVEHVEAEHA